MNQERTKFTVSAQEAREIVYDDNEDFKEISCDIIDQRRWSTAYKWIGQRKDGKFFCVCYDKGSTEQQDQRAFEYEKEVEFEEVFPVEKVVIIYE